MDKRIRKPAAAHDAERTSLGQLIHQHVRLAIETAVHEELQAAFGTDRYHCREARRGYCHGTKERTLTGPSGPVALALPRPQATQPRTQSAEARAGGDPRQLSSHHLRGECRRGPCRLRGLQARVGQTLPGRDDEPGRRRRRAALVLPLPFAQWKTLRTTNTIERLHEEFRRRVKTQGSLPSEDAALVLLFSLVASGQAQVAQDRRLAEYQGGTSTIRRSPMIRNCGE
jgi:transposase-like protein